MRHLIANGSHETVRLMVAISNHHDAELFPGSGLAE